MNPSSREEAKRVWCRFAGPGRGDCEHYVGIPKEEKYPETVDEYGIPHGWCEYCWSVEKRNRLTALLEKKDAESKELQRRLDGDTEMMFGYQKELREKDAEIERLKTALLEAQKIGWTIHEIYMDETGRNKVIAQLEAQNKALREMVEYMSQLKHYGHDIEAGCTVVCSWADKAKALLKAGGR